MKKILLAFGLIFAFATPIVVTSNALDNQAHAECAADLIQKGADSTGQKDARSAGDLAICGWYLGGYHAYLGWYPICIVGWR